MTSDLGQYARIVVAFSGGKDSVAAFLALLEAGVDRERIELWHHDVDGGGDPFMDWPSTSGYVRAFAAAFGVRLLLLMAGGRLPARDAAPRGRHCANRVRDAGWRGAPRRGRAAQHAAAFPASER